ncbi:MAG TPA: diguanylate cyclase [Pseudomonadales bacterium]|nr:diguanylate cyclase [Pseudomonadales bacterium]
MHITLENILGRKSDIPSKEIEVDRELLIHLRKRITGDQFVFDVSFPEQLELNYQDNAFRHSIILIRFILIAGLCFFITLHLLEALSSELHALNAWFNRLPAIVVLGVLLFFSYHPNFKRNYQNPITLSIILTCLSVLSSVTYYSSETLITLNYVIVYIVYLFGILAMPITFRHAAVAGITIWGALVLVMYYVKNTPDEIFFLLSFLVACGVFGGVGFSYIMDRMSRVNFIQSKLLLVEKANLNKNNIKLEGLAKTDALTGIGNRRCFDEGLLEEWNRAIRNGDPLGLILLDIDYFKQYNDIYGHQAGDECLIQVAELLSGKIRRASDVLARYGGEEFALILPGLNKSELKDHAERICQTLVKLQIPHKGSKISTVLTCSVGAISWTLRPQDNLNEFVKTADEALYSAKKTGRNKVVMF